MRDAFAKGRIPIRRGVQHHAAKLSEDQVREIRALYAAGGITQTALGKRFGVRQNLVFLIVHLRIWTHVH
jgi:hypothetical protein